MDDYFDKAKILQDILIELATHERGDDEEYKMIRQCFINNPKTRNLLPKIIRECKSLYQFWAFIRYAFSTYEEKQNFIYSEFMPLLDYLENRTSLPADNLIADSLRSFDEAGVHSVWKRALERRESDPEGAITIARTLLETVCKHILDDNGVEYDNDIKLPSLYKLTAEKLNLSPSQHTKDIFKQILGGCSAIVNGLGSLRNKLSDAHGKDSKAVKPAPRHAELAVNLAGSVALFLVETYKNNIS